MIPIGVVCAKSSPLLCAIGDRYLSRLSVNANPGTPGPEGPNGLYQKVSALEHLLDVFASIDPHRDHFYPAIGHAPLRFLRGTHLD